MPCAVSPPCPPCPRRVPAAGSGTERGPALPACGSRAGSAGDAGPAGPEEERAGISGLVQDCRSVFQGLDAGFNAEVRSLPGLAREG